MKFGLMGYCFNSFETGANKFSGQNGTSRLWSKNSSHAGRGLDVEEAVALMTLKGKLTWRKSGTLKVVISAFTAEFITSQHRLLH